MSNTPTEPGFFWYRQDDQHCWSVREIYEHDGRIWTTGIADESENYPENFPGEWVPALPPLDDHNEPVTAEWLESLGWLRKTNREGERVANSVNADFVVAIHPPDDVYLMDMSGGSVELGTYKTRGEFLGLCKALQIPMGAE